MRSARAAPGASIDSRYALSAASPSLSRARTRASIPSTQSVRRHARALRQPLERGFDERRVARPRRRLGQLADDELADAHVVAVLERRPRGVARRVVAADAVVRGPRSAYVATSTIRPSPRALAACVMRSISSGRERAPGRARPRASSPRSRPPGCPWPAAIARSSSTSTAAAASSPAASAAAGEEVERELQLHERAGVAGDLRPGATASACQASASHSSRAISPRRPRAGEPEPAAEVAGAASSASTVERPLQRRRGRRVALGQPERERVEHDVHRAGRGGRRRRGARGLGRLEQCARVLEVAGPDRRPERLEVRLRARAGVERLEAPGRAAEQRARRRRRGAGRTRSSPRRCSTSAACSAVERSRLGRGEQIQGRVERAGVALGMRRREQAAARARPGRA